MLINAYALALALVNIIIFAISNEMRCGVCECKCKHAAFWLIEWKNMRAINNKIIAINLYTVDLIVFGLLLLIFDVCANCTS